MLLSGRQRALLRTAVNGVMLHKLRSLLTVLGLVFGVASVIVMLAVGEGASRQAQEQIEALGVTNVIVRTVKPTESDAEVDFRAFEQDYGLTYADLRRIDDTIVSAIRITPMREFPQEARYGAQKIDCRLVAVHPSYFEANRIGLARGRFLEPVDLEQRANVCVIGEEVARKVFREQSPLGKSIQVANRHFFQVVGVQSYKTPSAGVGSSLSAQDLNRDIVIPLSTDRSRIGDVIERVEQGSYSRQRLELSQITVEVRDRYQVKSTANALEGLLAKYHPQKDYVITVPLDLLEQAQATQRIFNFVLGATAAISLLVGGIGIMNIMLATVSERTHEIGIRRALGAKQSDIIFQFLIETVTLSLFGTGLGVLLGLAAPSLVTYLSGMDTVVTIWSVGVAVVVSLTVGIAFGIYPARQAARLDPIEALRRA
ncbi:ABC transporter permease [Bythopirellula goksoeyrii]|uniref:Macrolide export ATP-binding/permease protein MacB n=1 Tax=Bythopirellula goksoeyrii TaxID=1400387 RepID=A0A5B9Q6H7_9BACT|nr:ABC transporter permease [Bythopirellula goksoeyrii]QEG34618.1 Macrolide export ATP-binding/permease protein MacB [Bythopirellula goksoeyrii]